MTPIQQVPYSQQHTGIAARLVQSMRMTWDTRNSVLLMLEYDGVDATVDLDISVVLGLDLAELHRI